MKILLCILGLIFLFPGLTKSQTKKQRERSYTSAFYDQPVSGITAILIEYRPELFRKNNPEVFIKTFTGKCNAKNVQVFFAETGSPEADSLKSMAGFVCRVNGAKHVSGYTPATAHEQPFYIMPGTRSKSENFMIQGFLNIDSGYPVWKCFCNNLDNSSLLLVGTNPSVQAAECLFDRLVEDGIIQ